jgi:ubiquinone/menaquinone biosynthesis C-methylase UbiE
VTEHADVVRREFTRQAPEFAGARSFFGDREIAEWIGSHLPLEPDSSVLDVCGGAGHLSRRLADRARQFVVLDLTPEILETGRRGAEEEGVRNVLFVEGDAAAMPFVDDSFDVAVSRFAFHHLSDPEAVTREMTRVVRPGGHVAIVDMVDGGHRHNELERLRDPSHTSALPEQELVALLERAGASIVDRDERRQALAAEPWLTRAHTATPEASEQILQALRAELEGGEPTGLEAHEDDGRLHVAQRWLLLVGRNL